MADHLIRSIMESGKYPKESPPDPLALFRLQNEVYSGANVFAFQKAFGQNVRDEEGKWGFDVFYETLEGDGMSCKFFQMTDLTIVNSFTRNLDAAATSYVSRFSKSFPLPAPFNTRDHAVFAQAMTSNMLGGIGYYQGASIVDRSFKHDYDDDDDDDGAGTEKPLLTEERELLTATPSRSFFPRGFYWDEGFHLALIGEWDNDLR